MRSVALPSGGSHSHAPSESRADVCEFQASPAQYAEWTGANHLTKLTNAKSDDAVISSFAYLVDRTGNRTKMTLSSGDYLECLYDEAGNRTKQIHSAGAATTTTYYYDPGNKLTKSIGATTTTCSYDGNGSLTQEGNGATTKTFAYDLFGMMKSYSDGTNSGTYCLACQRPLATYAGGGRMTLSAGRLRRSTLNRGALPGTGHSGLCRYQGRRSTGV